jgi:hypothetical protein
MIKKIPDLGRMLPYISTTTVHAGEVESIIWDDEHTAAIHLVVSPTNENGFVRYLRAHSKGLRSRYPADCNRVMVVTYPDGYVSFCPTESFLRGYEEVQS